jgi:hypothetical protein
MRILTFGRPRYRGDLLGLNPHIINLAAYDETRELRYSYYNAIGRFGSAGIVRHQQDVISQADKDAVTETGGPGSWNNITGIFDGADASSAWYNNLTGYPYVDFDFEEKVGWYQYWFSNRNSSDYATNIWLYGSNDSESREDNLLDSRSGLGSGGHTFMIPPANLGNYRYWRLKGWKSASNWWRLYEVSFYRLPQYIFVNVPSQHTIKVYNDATLTERVRMSAYDWHTMEFFEPIAEVNRIVISDAGGNIYLDEPFSPEFMYKYSVWPMETT